MEQTERRAQPGGGAPDTGFDRRALLRRAAIAGAVSWTAPVILTSEIASAGVFTAKCAPGTTTASASFVRTACLASTSVITITIVFSGLCPCGGAGTWCAQKNLPTPIVASATSTLSFSVTVPIFGSTAISGKVAHQCTDRDGDTQYAVYDWSMSASDNGGACNTVVNSITAVTLTNRTLVISVSCPSLAAAFAPVPVAGPQTSETRTRG